MRELERKIPRPERQQPIRLPEPLPDLRLDRVEQEVLQNLLNLRDEGHLDPNLIRKMHEACRSANLTEIIRLAGINRALLFAPSVREQPQDVQCWPLHALLGSRQISRGAVQECLVAFIGLLNEQPEKGLALASLLHPDSEGYLPLQRALKNKTLPPASALHLMAWMGNSLDASKNLLSIHSEEIFLPLLNACMVQNRLDWFDAVLVWGGRRFAFLGGVAGAKYEHPQPKPLEVAIQQGSADFVRRLIRKGANPSARTEVDSLPLLALAAQTGNKDIVRILLEKDANPDAKMPKGYESLRSLPLVAEVLSEMKAVDDDIKRQTELAKEKRAQEKKRKRAQERDRPYSPKLFRESKEETQLTQLFKYVAENNTEQAEAMIRENPRLLLASGFLKDVDARTFKKTTVRRTAVCSEEKTIIRHFVRNFDEITAFQYARWTRNFEMMEMMLPYLGDEEAGRQFQELETYSTDHGRGFEFLPLKHALSTLNDPPSFWGNNEREQEQERAEHFVEKVGGEQLLLPTHFIHRFCRPGIEFGFCPIPDFSDKNSVRTTTLSNGSEWFSKDEDGNMKLGSTVAIVRGKDSHAVPSRVPPAHWNLAMDTYDLAAMIVFDQVCSKKLKELALRLGVVMASEPAWQEVAARAAAPAARSTAEELFDGPKSMWAAAVFQKSLKFFHTLTWGAKYEQSHSLQENANPDAKMPKEYESLCSLPLVAEVEVLSEMQGVKALEEETKSVAEEKDEKLASKTHPPAAAFFKVAPKLSWKQKLQESIEAWQLKAAIAQSLENADENTAAAALSEQARAYDCRVHKMERDGNCFFHAVSDQLHRLGEKVSADTLRAEVAHHVIENIADYCAFSSLDRDTLIFTLSKRGEWADEIALRALSHTRQKTLVIVRSDGQQPTVMTPVNSNGVLILGYEVGLHYESLTRMDGTVGLTPSLQERIDHPLHPAMA